MTTNMLKTPKAMSIGKTLVALSSKQKAVVAVVVSIAPGVRGFAASTTCGCSLLLCYGSS